MATARKSAKLFVNRYDLGNSRHGRLQCPWASDTVTLAGISHLQGLGMPCNELVAKCGLKAAAESSAVLYITIAVAVGLLDSTIILHLRWRAMLPTGRRGA